MKTVLSFITEKSDNDEYTVYFSADQKRDVVHAFAVDLQIDTDNPKLVAELAVIRHVMLRSGLVEDPCSETFAIQCSQGAIRKLIRKSSDKVDACSFSRFLTTRFPGIEIKVKHDKSLINKNSVVKKLVINKKPLESEKTDIGKIKLTEHAVARYHERFHADKPIGRAASILVNTLRGNNLQAVNVDRKKRSRSLIKHHRDAEYYRAGDSCLVVVPEGHHKALVTVLPQMAA